MLMRLRRTLAGGGLLLFMIVLTLACGGERGGETAGPSKSPDHDLSRLVDWLTGSFSSAAQAGQDPDYFDIRIHAVRVWPERDDGQWIYLEQAAADALDQPYRQRVYHVTRLADDLFQSRVYALEEPLNYAGQWREEEPLAQLRPEDLQLRDGCAVLLRKVGDETFTGSTLGRLCSSTLRGASFATSEVAVRSDRLTSWDRGFDADGVQVWGAQKGPYQFDRVERAPGN
jgi:hypothetical protein